MKLCKDCKNKGKKKDCEFYSSISNHAERCRDFEPVEPSSDVSCMAAVTRILQEVAEDICNNYCKYRDSADEESLCEIIRSGRDCPLDKLN